MLILLSPAKRLDFEPVERDLTATKPELLADAKKIAAVAKQLSPKQIAKLMNISDSLATTAHEYFQGWKQKWDARGAKQAALAFRGDVYLGLEAETLSDDDFEFAQDRLRILSGLYGVLRPLDHIQPYRLEMGRALKNERGKDLYAFWCERVTQSVNAAAQQAAEAKPLVVNLASKEYSAVVDWDQIEAQVVTPNFKDLNKGKYKVLSFFAKKARGMMARYLIDSRAAGEADLRKFRGGGYRFNRELSSPDNPTFTRDKPS